MKLRSILTTGLGFAIALSFGWVAFPSIVYRRQAQPLQFNHAVHTGENVGMTCEDCHTISDDGVFQGIPPLESCAACHSEPQGKTANEKRFVDEWVTPNREVPWLVYARQPANAWFPHAPHVKLAGIACTRCHGPHGTTTALRPFEENRLSGYSRDVEGYSLARLRTAEWERGMKMDDCAGCHHERGVRESCLTCHK